MASGSLCALQTCQAQVLGLDDGLVEGVPIWPMIFYCLRCGDVSAALQASVEHKLSLGLWREFVL